MSSIEKLQWILIAVLCLHALVQRHRWINNQKDLKQLVGLIKDLDTANTHNVRVINDHAGVLEQHDRGLKSHATAISTMTKIFVEEKQSK